MSYILILVFTVGVISEHAIAVTNVQGFTDIAQCDAAGRDAVKKFKAVRQARSATYMCIAQKRKENAGER